MAIERQVLEQELLFEATIEDLQRPNLVSLDIENGLDALSKLNRLSPAQARTILDLGSANITAWTRVSEPAQLLAGFRPAARVYQEYAKHQDRPEVKAEAQELISTIVAGVIATDRQAYKAVSSQLKNGAFGEYGPTLVGVVQKLSTALDREGTIWGDAETDTSNLVVMLGELQKVGDPLLIEAVKPAIPTKLLDVDQATRMTYTPEMNQLLEEARRGNDPETKKLVALYLDSDFEEQDELRHKMVRGEFGNAAVAVDKIISTLMTNVDKLDDDQRAAVEDAAYDLWLDVLDQDPYNPQLQSITANVMEIGRYWEDDIVYTSIESINRLGLVGREELFVAKYGDRILKALAADDASIDMCRKKQLKQQEHLTPDQQQRIARFLKELGYIERNSGKNLHKENLITGRLLGTII